MYFTPELKLQHYDADIRLHIMLATEPLYTYKTLASLFLFTIILIKNLPVAIPAFSKIRSSVSAGQPAGTWPLFTLLF